jgi:trimeric autotransporter adhesin
MKTILLLLFIGIVNTAWAQIGINTTTPNAQLEITASNQVTPASTDGIIIPKIDAFPIINPTAAQQSMLVYLTTVSGTNQSGFYYWNNATTNWIPLSTGANNDWSITGNAGTNAAANFIGTTDNNNIAFKRNNVKAGLIGFSTTSFGYGSYSQESFTGILLMECIL